MMTKFRSILLLIILAAAATVEAQKPSATPKPHSPTVRAVVIVRPGPPPAKLSPDKERRLRAFNQAWGTINSQYFDQTFGGLNWTSVREEYLPRVRAAATDAEVHEIILEMVNRLNKSHFGLVPPEYYTRLRVARREARAREKLASGRPADEKEAVVDDGDDEGLDELEQAAPAHYGVGINIRVISGRFVITSVNAGSAAADAGVKPGFILDKINGVSMTDLAQKLIAGSAHVRHFDRFLPTLITGWILNSEHDSKVQLTCLDAADAPQVFEIKRRPLAGESVTLGMSTPPMFFEYESHLAAPDVGYVKFNVFAWQVLGKFCDSITEFADKKAVIIDLRGNVGGLIFAMEGLSAMLNDRKLSLGTAVYRSGPVPLAVDAKKRNFKGRVIFLVDDQSMSASELLSAGLQDTGRALIVGQRTAGEALPAVTVRLATGAVLLYPIANYIAPSGKTIEGSGVEPDYSVPLDRKTLLTGSDPQLERAIALAQDDAGFEKLSERRLKADAAAKLEKPADLSEEDAPPPPKPMPKPATVAGSRPQPPPRAALKLSAPRAGNVVPPVPIVGKDPRAVRILADFAAAVGGPAAVRTYDATGFMQLNYGEGSVRVRYRTYRSEPDKFVVVINTDAMGEMREVHVGKDVFVDSNTGIADSIKPGDIGPGRHYLASLFDLTSPEYFKALKFEGEYEAEGKRLQVVNALTSDGTSIAMTFDPVAKTLERVAVTGIGSTVTYSDYRKTAGFMLPYKMLIGGYVDIELNSLTINQPIDPSMFEKKQNCFDKP
ncbi:MAG: S41 family peptidase [Acidobacteriota bacterium]